MKCSVKGCRRQAHHFMKDKQFCDDHWQQYQMHLDLKLKREVQPKKIDVVQTMDRIEHEEFMGEYYPREEAKPT